MDSRDPLFETAFKLLDKGQSVADTRAHLLETAEKFGYAIDDVEDALKRAINALAQENGG